jgi:hypothetical protein
MNENKNIVNKLRQTLIDKIQNKIQKKGVESAHISGLRVLKLKIDHIQGDPSSRGIKELSNSYMLDSSGYQYDYSNLSVDDLAWLVDTL